MGLDLEQEQRLRNEGFVDFFEETEQDWQAVALRGYQYMHQGFPEGAAVRQDDVVKAIEPIVEVDPRFQEHKSEQRLSQKYWVEYFANLIVDRCWATILDQAEEG